MELAIATQTAPRDWWDESAAVIVTAIDVLQRQAEQMERRKR